MRTRIHLASVVLTTLLLAGLMPSTVAAQVAPASPVYDRLPAPEVSKDRPRPRRDAGTVLVKFKPNTSKSAQGETLERYGAQERGTAGSTGYTVASIEDGETPEEAVRELKGDPTVSRAQLNYLRWASATPNDPALAFGDQEYLKKIRLLAGWDKTKGTATRTIAILDTGIDADHPDLAARIKPGFNALTGTTNTIDDNGHGTFVAGIAGAITNNNRGIAGAAWNTSLLPVKVLGADGVGTDADVAEGITWAANHGASVINLSLGGPGFSQVLLDAVNYAKTKNIVLVGAAGNEGWNVPSYPAAFEGVLAVTATDNSQLFAFFSNHGWWVDVAAPGINIVSTFRGSGELYGIGSGTSFAAPLVAGVALLLKTQNPSWSHATLYNRIRNTAQDVGPRGMDPSYGKGFLDAYAALGAAVKAPAAQPAGDVFEFNPTLDRAKALGTSASASISPETDVDYFYKDVTAPGSVTFTVTPPAFDDAAPRTREMDPVLVVFGPGLELLGVVDAAFLGDPETITVPAKSVGRYTAAVYNFFGSRSPSNYTLTAATSLNPLPSAFTSVTRDLPNWPDSVAIGDVTGDGRADAVITTAWNNDPATDYRVWVYPQLADGSLATTPIKLDTSGSNPGWVHLELADLTGDGRTDIAVGMKAGIQLFAQTAGGFAAPVTLPTSAHVSDHEVVDVDGDGDLDFLLNLADKLAVLKDTGPSYTESTIAAQNLYEIEAGDLNGDGRVDFAGQPGAGCDVRVYRQNADGSFTASNVPTTDRFCLDDVGIRDVNGDGRDDLIAAISDNLGNPVVDLFLQQAGGTLAGAMTIPLEANPVVIEAGDLNEDGRLDLATGAFGYPTVHQRANGTFGPAVSLLPDGGTQSLSDEAMAIGDLNSDGLEDILSSNGQANGGKMQVVYQTPVATPVAFVRDHSPADFSLNIGTANTPTVEFGRAMNAATFTSITVNILNAKTMTSIGITRSYNAANRVLTLDPTSALLKNTPYIVSITGGVKDVNGVSMGGLYRYRFKTAA